MKETKTPRQKLEQEFANLETTRERIIGEIKKIDDHETETIHRLDILVGVYETAKVKTQAGRIQWDEVEQSCGSKTLSEIWGSRDFNPSSAAQIIASRESKSKLREEFDAWLKAAEADEAQKLEAVRAFVADNQVTIDNRALPHNQSAFTRSLPVSLDPYINPKS